MIRPAKPLYKLEYFKKLFHIFLLFPAFCTQYFAQNKFAMSYHFSDKESFFLRFSGTKPEVTFENYALNLKNRKFLSFDVFF